MVGKPGDAEADEGNLSRVLAYTRGDAHNREAACGLDHLLVARAGTRVVDGHDHFAKNFAWLERRREGVNEEIGRAYGALRFCSLQNELRFERRERSRIIRCGIGVRHAATDGAHVAHLHVADRGCGLSEQGTFLAQQGGALDFVMRSCSADVQLAASFANVVQVLQRAQVYQMLGHGKPQLHHGDEAHAAGERLGPAREQMQSFIERFRSGVFKFLSDHVGGSSQVPRLSSFSRAVSRFFLVSAACQCGELPTAKARPPRS